MDLYLDPGTHDISVSAYKMRYTVGLLETVRQRLAISLQVFLGEWFLDTSLGVPYYRDILVKNPALDVISNTFRRRILADPGVESVPRLDLELDSERVLHVSFDAVLIDDTILTLELPSDPVIAASELVIDGFGNTIITQGGDTVIHG